MAKVNKIATLKDIAQELGLSATAVSKALNNKGGVSKETEEKVKLVAKRLGYKPNIVAKSLRLNTTNTIGVLISDSSYSFFPKVIKGLEETAAENGYNIILCNTGRDEEREKDAISVLINKRVDGIILAASRLTGLEHMDYLKSLGIPFVFLIRRSESDDLDYVVNDNVLGSYLLVSYLLKSGGQNIHFFNLPENSPSSIDRLAGYKRALEENKVDFDASLVEHIKPEIEEGYIMMRQYLERNDPINTVFCGCDVIAIGVMEAILEKGLRVPEDIRVAGYDDIDFASYLRVPLTTVRQPRYSIGCKGMELLIRKIKNKKMQTQHIVLKPELVVRQST